MGGALMQTIDVLTDAHDKLLYMTQLASGLQSAVSVVVKWMVKLCADALIMKIAV